jgi:hypothetical protein
VSGSSKRPMVSLSFAEGKYFDLWMVVHFMSGVAGGFSNVYFALPPFWVFVLAFAMMLAWEVVEYVNGIRESFSNRVVDIAVGLLGVWLALAVAGLLEPPAQWLAFALTLAIGIVGMAFGVRARRRRRVSAT